MSSWCSKCDFQECGPLGVHKCYCGHFRRDHVCDEPENAKPRAIPATAAQLEANRGAVPSLEELKKNTSPETGADQGICPTCNKILGFEAVLIVSGTRMHKACASKKICAKCKGPVAGAYVGSGGQYFHKECAGLTGICPGCNETLSGQMVTVSGKKYHAACLNCATCKKNVVGGFLQKGELVYCEPCFEPFLETTVETVTVEGGEEDGPMGKFEDKYTKWTTAIFGGGQGTPSSPASAAGASNKWAIAAKPRGDDSKEKEKKAQEKAAKEAEQKAEKEKQTLEKAQAKEKEKADKLAKEMEQKEAKEKANAEKAAAKEREKLEKEKEKLEKSQKEKGPPVGAPPVTPPSVAPPNASFRLPLARGDAVPPPRAGPLPPTSGPPRGGPLPPSSPTSPSSTRAMSPPPRATSPSPLSPSVPSASTRATSPPPRALSPSPAAPARTPAVGASQSMKLPLPPKGPKGPDTKPKVPESEEAAEEGSGDRKIITFRFGAEVKKIRLPPATVKLGPLEKKLLKAFPVSSLTFAYMQGGTQIPIVDDDILLTALTTCDEIICKASI